jgi:hypothetical protein
LLCSRKRRREREYHCNSRCNRWKEARRPDGRGHNSAAATADADVERGRHCRRTQTRAERGEGRRTPQYYCAGAAQTEQSRR